MARRDTLGAAVLVFKEKHGNRYFHIPDNKALHAAALKVLTDRHKDGYWCYKPDEPKKPDVTTEGQIEALPKSLQETALHNLQDYERNLRYFTQELKIYNAIVKAVEEKDGEAAWELLNARRDAEYEGFSLERYEDV